MPRALLLGLAGCGGGGSQTDTAASQTSGATGQASQTSGATGQGATSAAAAKLSSHNQFLVAEARTAISETADSGQVSKDTRQGVQELIDVCHKHPDSAYGASPMSEVLQQGAGDLQKAAPPLAGKLRRQARSGCKQ